MYSFTVFNMISPQFCHKHIANVPHMHHSFPAKVHPNHLTDLFQAKRQLVMLDFYQRTNNTDCSLW